jgi:hypothetical protein
MSGCRVVPSLRAGAVFKFIVRETPLFLRLWANASSEAYLRAHRHGGSCGSQRIRTHDFFSIGEALALRKVVGTITRKRSQDIVNKWRQAEIWVSWTKTKAKALNFRQGPARATTRTMERRGVVREGGRRAQRITSACVRRTCGIARRQPSKGASAACGGEEGDSRRETGMATRQRRARLGARSVITRRRSGSCGSRAKGPLSFSGSKIARRQLSN